MPSLSAARRALASLVSLARRAPRPLPSMALWMVALAVAAHAPGAPVPALTRHVAQGEVEIAASSLDTELEAEEALVADEDVLAFAHDLQAAVPGTSDARAHRVATLAVRAARRQQLPLPLLFGLMLTENRPLDSRARSSAGALGLMQVMPFWTRSMGATHGHDLRDDATNIATGAHVLDLMFAAEENDVRRGLLRYNGCSGGRRCRGYASRVLRSALTEAPVLCPSRSYEACVGRAARDRRPVLVADAEEGAVRPAID
jgi:soluble lytic murein transglycosylase-like protein